MFGYQHNTNPNLFNPNFDPDTKDYIIVTGNTNTHSFGFKATIGEGCYLRYNYFRGFLEGGCGGPGTWNSGDEWSDTEIPPDWIIVPVDDPLPPAPNDNLLCNGLYNLLVIQVGNNDFSVVGEIYKILIFRGEYDDLPTLPQ